MFTRKCFSAAFVLMAALLFQVVVVKARSGDKPVTGADEHYKQGVAARNKQDYATAITEFRKVIELDPGHSRAHSSLASAVVYAYQHALRAASQGEVARPGVAPAASVQDAKKQLTEIRELYMGWAKQYPDRAAYQYALGILSDQDFHSKERYFLKAVALDPTLTEVYTDLAYQADLHGDDQAQLKYLKKASETSPTYLMMYANKLKDFDFVAHQKLLRELKQKYAGTDIGARAFQALALEEADPPARIAMLEELKKLYPVTKYVATKSAMRGLFDAYATADPGKALTLAEEMTKCLPEGGEKTYWQTFATYQKNLIQAHAWMGEKKFSETVALLEQTPLPRYMDPTEVELFKAEAAEKSGDTSKAYESLARFVARQPNDAMNSALMQYGAKLGKSPQQVEAELREARLKKASPLLDFELARYPDGKKVRSSDFRGRVVMVNFWYPLWGACIGEFPYLQKILKKYQSKNFTVLSINVHPQEDEMAVAFVKNKGYEFITLRAPSTRWVVDAYALKGAPTNYLVDTEGRIIFRPLLRDDATQRTVELEIEALLAQSTKGETTPRK